MSWCRYVIQYVSFTCSVEDVQVWKMPEIARVMGICAVIKKYFQNYRKLQSQIMRNFRKAIFIYSIMIVKYGISFQYTYLNCTLIFHLSFDNIYIFSFIFISWRLITFQYCKWVLSYIDMNQPWIYMYSPSRSPLPPPSLPDPSGSSQYTRPEHFSHASNLGWWSVSP